MVLNRVEEALGTFPFRVTVPGVSDRTPSIFELYRRRVL